MNKHEQKDLVKLGAIHSSTRLKEFFSTFTSAQGQFEYYIDTDKHDAVSELIMILVDSSDTTIDQLLEQQVVSRCEVGDQIRRTLPSASGPGASLCGHRPRVQGGRRRQWGPWGYPEGNRSLLGPSVS